MSEATVKSHSFHKEAALSLPLKIFLPPHSHHSAVFMNPPLNSHSRSHVLLVILLLLFAGMEASLFGGPKPMLDTRNINIQRTDRSNDPLNNQEQSNEITAKNRRQSNLLDSNPLSPDSDDDDDTHLLSSPVKPTRQSIVGSRRFSGNFDLSFSSLANTAKAAKQWMNQTRKKQTASSGSTLTDSQQNQPTIHITPPSIFEQAKLYQTARIENQEQQTTIQQQIFGKNQAFEKQNKKLLQAFLEKKQAAVLNRTAFSWSRGMPSSAHLPEAAITQLRAELVRQQSVARLANRFACYDLEGDLLKSYLLKRSTILPDEQTSTNQNDFQQLNEKVAEALTNAQYIGNSLIKATLPKPNSSEEINLASITTEQLNSLSAEQITFLNNVLDFVGEIQFFILGCHTSLYITASKDRLDEVETYLEKNDPQKNDGTSLIITHYSQVKELLQKSKYEFSLMETISAQEAINAAEKNAASIEEMMMEVQELENSLITAQEYAVLSRVEILKTETEEVAKLHASLQIALLAYRELQDEVWIEKKCDPLHDLQEKIEKKQQALLSTSLIENNTQSLLNKFTPLLKSQIFQLDELHSLPQHPSKFLDELEKLDRSFAQEAIVGTHGKIALEVIPQKIDNNDYLDLTRKDWTAGRDLIRLGLCRGFGIHVMKQFDQKNQIFVRERNPLIISNLKQFLFNEDRALKYARSFFIPLEMTHENFLQRGDNLAATHADKVIKMDTATFAFNPFDKKAPIISQEETLAAAELRQRKAGFEYVREALKLAFPEASLSAKQLDEVLQTFDTQFKLDRSITEKPALTFAASARFIRHQKEILKNRSYWKKNVSPYLDQEALRYVRNGVLYAIGTQTGTAIIVALPSLYLYYLWLSHKIASSTST